MATSTRPSSQPNKLDSLVSALAAHKQTWLTVTPAERARLLQACLDRVPQVAPAWVEAACQAKGIDPQSNLAGEEWLSGPLPLVMHLQQYRQALQAEGKPQPISWRTDQGQQIAQIFPRPGREQLLWWGYKAEVWLEPGKPASQGRVYQFSETASPESGQVALVLGAGNIASITPLDGLYKLLVENQVVLLKLNPVNDYLAPFFAKIFAPLIQLGVWAQVKGDAGVGEYLCQHPQIEAIHITGSHHTHNQIVWGGEPQPSQQPRLNKPISAELGNVTPILVVPGRWSAADLAFQARHVAAMVAHNASFNCTAAQVLVTALGWPQRAEFLAEVRQALAQIPPRHAYYPGAQRRYQQFLAAYPQAEPLSQPSDSIIPWTIIPNVPAQPGELALTEEAFCGILAEVALPATTAVEFLAAAVGFANETLWGNLCCNLLIHPQTQKRLGDAWPQALAQLRYGTIGINIWTGVSFGLGVTPWGAFPGNSLENIGSGQGFVHNTYLFDYPQKTVLSAPFRIWPTPPWFADHPNLANLGQRLFVYEMRPSWGNFFRAVGAALSSRSLKGK